MIERLMRRLIAGDWVGPATAIGQDYKVLEMKGVIQVRPASGGMFDMKLLKADIGRLALEVVTEGEATTQPLGELPAVSASSYGGPEENRVVVRRNQGPAAQLGVAQLLEALRTGELR